MIHYATWFAIWFFPEVLPVPQICRRKKMDLASFWSRWISLLSDSMRAMVQIRWTIHGGKKIYIKEFFYLLSVIYANEGKPRVMATSGCCTNNHERWYAMKSLAILVMEDNERLFEFNDQTRLSKTPGFCHHHCFHSPLVLCGSDVSEQRVP